MITDLGGMIFEEKFNLEKTVVLNSDYLKFLGIF